MTGFFVLKRADFLRHPLIFGRLDQEKSKIFGLPPDFNGVFIKNITFLSEYPLNSGTFAPKT
jgi:hypothetical protein